MDYQGKRVVIIGGSSGFGLATAQRLVDHGASVMITGRTAATLAAAERQLGTAVIAIRSDAASAQDRNALAERIAAEFGQIDLLFVSAGISRAIAFEDMTEGDYDAVLDVNVKGPYFTVQQLAPLLADGASVVLTTSVSNVKGMPNSSAYSASKAAMRSMARTLARELLPRHVRVNAVSPGPIDTGILERSLPADMVEPTKAQMRQNNPMGRFGDPDEVARAVLFLAFEATFTTGAELPVDGGVSQLL